MDGTNDAASSRIAAQLRQAILDGELVPGQRIRQEDIAAQHGSSRLPVREALRMLETDGLAVLEPNKGARVVHLGADELDVVYRMRERLEPLAIELSVPGLTEETLDRLDALEAQIEANDDVGQFVKLDREFHLLTYSGSAIQPLAGTVERMWNTTEHHRRTFMEISGSSRRWVVHAEHNLLLDALRRRDAADAARFVEGHIRRSRLELVRHARERETGS